MSKLKELQARAKKTEDSRPQESSDVKADKANVLQATSHPEQNAAKDGAGFLQSFLNVTPAFNLFEHIADRMYGGGRSHVKVTKLKTTEPVFYQICQWIDLTIRVTVAIILVIIATKAAFKILRG